MFEIIKIIISLAAMSPPQAARVAGALTGADSDALVTICRRESRCRYVGEHARDAHLSRRSWLGHVRLGQLDPSCQPYRPGWATRGPWGLNAAAHHHLLPPCYQPEWLDVPLVSAVVAAMKWDKVCSRRPRARWCGRSRDRTETNATQRDHSDLGDREGDDDA